MSKRKPVHLEHIPNKLRAERRYVKRFWEKHYRYKSVGTPQKLKVEEVFSLWKLCYPEVETEFSRFNDLTRNLGVKVSRGKNKKVEHYFADPLTDLSNSYHGIGTGERPLTLNLLNVQGLVTQSQNKADVLSHLLKTTEPGKICLLTETHLHGKTNAEINKYTYPTII